MSVHEVHYLIVEAFVPRLLYEEQRREPGNESTSLH